MGTLAFGMTMLVLGLGGTLAALGLLVGCLHVLMKLFPADEAAGNQRGGSGDA